MKPNESYGSKMRRLFVVDIENYKGKAVLTKEDAFSAKTEIEDNLGVGPTDLVLIGTSHKFNFLNAKLAWPGAQHCFISGHNGADIALISAAEQHLKNAETFCEVVLLSGDGIFTKLMCKVKQLGIKGTVVSLADQINENLAYASSSCTLIAPAA